MPICGSGKMISKWSKVVKRSLEPRFKFAIDEPDAVHLQRLRNCAQSAPDLAWQYKSLK